MIHLIIFLQGICDLLSGLVVAVAVMSWLIAFNVVNMHNNVVRSVWTVLTAITDPMVKPFRRFIPQLGGIDFSPMALLVVILFVKNVALPTIGDAILGR